MGRMTVILTTVLTSLISASVYAGEPVVPEIDGASAMLGLGLTAGIVALVREYRRRK